MPITPNIIQTMKHTVNAAVLATSTETRLYATGTVYATGTRSFPGVATVFFSLLGRC
jgi:hypothetical protein